MWIVKKNHLSAQESSICFCFLITFWVTAGCYLRKAVCIHSLLKIGEKGQIIHVDNIFSTVSNFYRKMGKDIRFSVIWIRLSDNSMRFRIKMWPGICSKIGSFFLFAKALWTKIGGGGVIIAPQYILATSIILKSKPIRTYIWSQNAVLIFCIRISCGRLIYNVTW